MTLVPLVLCGGSGSRLWPLSRAMYPKQLLALTDSLTLLQQTVARLSGLPSPPADPIVICNHAHRFLVADQLTAMRISPTLVLEPQGRNTAPAAAIAALLRERAGAGDDLLLVLPADHVILDDKALAAAIEQAIPAAQNGRLVTFGVVPTRPETGYGYIRALEGEGPVFEVDRFVEKPDYETAFRYCESGAYYWNSGMFLFSATAYLDELRRSRPEIAAACEASIGGAQPDAREIALDQEVFSACPSDSIDYAVMEDTDLASVVPLDAGWNDVGSWAALHDVSERDADGNTVRGDVLALDCKDTYVCAENRLVAVAGLDGCIVVETKDAVLVVPRDRAQDVKKLVDELDAQGREETRLGREVFRPWGSYDSLESLPGFQVKRLTVLPGAILSLQLHQQRAEHWVVVAGLARITRDDEVFDLGVSEHTFIPIGAKHRIENPGAELLHIIEVQVGDYLGEDDIVRFEDKYGREGRTD